DKLRMAVPSLADFPQGEGIAVGVDDFHGQDLVFVSHTYPRSHMQLAAWTEAFFQLGQLSVELFSLVRVPFWPGHLQYHNLIARVLAREAFAFKPQLPTTGGTPGHLYIDLAAHRWHRHCGTQSGFPGRNRNGDQNIMAFHGEMRVRCQLHFNKQITGLATTHARSPLPFK